VNADTTPGDLEQLGQAGVWGMHVRRQRPLEVIEAEFGEVVSVYDGEGIPDF
jgi:hypothetical protein